MCASPADTPIEPSAMGRQLRDGGPILVGHNVFHDLCFLHETFLGDNNEGPVNKTLNDIDPGSLRRNLHHLFPRVLDTKYIASQVGATLRRDTLTIIPPRGPGEKAMVKAISKATRLQTLYESLLRAHSGVEEDTVVIGEGHFPVRVVPEPGFDPRKPGSAGAHHAGYDSWMTAVVLVATERELALARRGDAGMSKVTGGICSPLLGNPGHCGCGRRSHCVCRDGSGCRTSSLASIRSSSSIGSETTPSGGGWSTRSSSTTTLVRSDAWDEARDPFEELNPFRRARAGVRLKDGGEASDKAGPLLKWEEWKGLGNKLWPGSGPVVIDLEAE
jgi:hypothetical protein